MARNEDRALENLIRGSEELIRDLGEHGAPGQAASPPLADRIEHDLQQEEIKSLATRAELTSDGAVDVVVSKDQMIVHATFHPPTGAGAPIPLDAVREAIEARDVTAGIDWEAVKGCIQTCNEERIEVADAVIARGRMPVDEVPPFLSISDALVEKDRQDELPGARVDFRQLELFTLVKKGDVLATLTPRQEGIMGMTIGGAAVAFRKTAQPYPKPGKNTAWQSGNVVAGCDGRFQFNEGSFWVDEVLEIEGDVDLRVGNIDFPGDVVIKGEIRDGFVVKAGKSVLSLGSIGAVSIDCKGDLVTRQGIIGKEKAVIRVGGDTEAKFVEGCSLDSTGTIRVRTSVMNSTIHTGNRLEMGDRGIIIGGIVRAANGVTATQIGAERGPRTEIHCGLDFKVEQKLVWIRDRNIGLAFKCKEIEARMKSNAETQKVLAPLREKLKAAIHQLNESARSIVSGLDRNENAEVSVLGSVYPGTYIEICHVSHFITKPIRFVTFRLDKSAGKIVETKWEKPPDSPKARARGKTGTR